MEGGNNELGEVPRLTSKKSEGDEYEVICTIGKGAYGKVSLARRSGKLYALKQI
jgi:serine/threonine protein kinase